MMTLTVRLKSSEQKDNRQAMETTMRNSNENNFGKQLRRASACAVAMGAMALGLAGCNGMSPSTPAVQTGKAMKGVVHGGQQPVVGATVTIYTVGSTGNGSASAALTGGTTTTDVLGNFAFAPNAWNCSTPTATKLYVVATGGNTGSGVNANSAMMIEAGDCGTILANQATTTLFINEVTTVAAAYALAPFATDYLHIGNNGVLAPMTMAFNHGFQLANIATGNAPGVVPTGGTVPTAEINTLADILAACINTTGAASPQCTTLFAATGGATNTIDAAFYIAKHPGAAAVTNLYTLASPQSPFQPTQSLASAPNDYTIAVNYTAQGNLNTPYGIAVDLAGNIWVTNEAGINVTTLNNLGGFIQNTTATGLVGPQGIAIDKNGWVYVANTAGDSVVQFQTLSNIFVNNTNSYLGGGGNAPTGLAIDSANNVWVTNFNGNSVIEINNVGTALQPGLTAGGSINAPTGIALDTAGNVYVANSGAGNVVKFTNAGAVAAGSPFTDNALQGDAGIAVDSSNNIWVTGSTTGATVSGGVSQFSNTGTAANYSPITSNVGTAAGVASGPLYTWVINGAASGSIVQLQNGTSTPISPAAGFGSLNTPVGIAIDATGTIWTTNSGDNTVSAFIGLANPVTTPLAANVGP